jgi:hypothetical protein
MNPMAGLTDFALVAFLDCGAGPFVDSTGPPHVSLMHHIMDIFNKIL